MRKPNLLGVTTTAIGLSLLLVWSVLAQDSERRVKMKDLPQAVTYGPSVAYNF